MTDTKTVDDLNLNHEECGVSTFIDDVTITAGQGHLSSEGDWEIPCPKCAARAREALSN